MTTFLAAIKGTQITEQPLTLFSGQLAPGSAPADANPPPTSWPQVGDGVTTDAGGGGWVPPLGSIRIDGFRQLSLSLEVFGTGAVNATFRPYFFDGVRWCQGADTVVVSNSQGSSNPLARQRHDLLTENDYGICLVLEAISGTAAQASAYATKRDPTLGRK